MTSVNGSFNVTSTKTKPVLHVEVRLKNAGTFVRNDLIREDVIEGLCNRYKVLKIGRDICTFEEFNQADAIESIVVTDCSGAPDDEHLFHLDKVTLDVQVYRLDDQSIDTCSPRPLPNPEVTDESEAASAQLRTTSLPSASLDGIWESLVFDQPIPARLLQYVSRMTSITLHATLSPNLVSWNRLILLHGPPGGGKSSLCRALAQKLTIRLGKHYTSGRLVEVNAGAFLSKWFGESSKLIDKLFENIFTMAAEETTLIVVLIDEVETLTSSREKAANSNECGDALRATNELLTCLDRAKTRDNILILATSNIPRAIDAAFLDRVDVKQFIPLPSAHASYDILRGSINELIRGGLVTSSPSAIHSRRGSASSLDWDIVDSSAVDLSGEHVLGLLPVYEEVRIHLFDRSENPGLRLSKVAERCAKAGMSGRSLRRLPVRALAMYTYGESCEIDECMSALEMTVGEMLMEGGGEGMEVTVL